MILVKDISSFSSSKIKSESDIKVIVDEYKKNGMTVGLCVGSYDLLHPGHIKHFDSAKSLCDVLIVAVTNDIYVKKRKGINRPIFSEKLRAYSISALSSVDHVLISNYERATELLQVLQPSYYIKGFEYKNKTTPGILSEKEKIGSLGGEIKYTIDEKLSTSEIINQILKKTERPIMVVGFGRFSKDKDLLLSEFVRRNNYVYLNNQTIIKDFKIEDPDENRILGLLFKIAKNNLKNNLNVMINTNYNKLCEETIENLLKIFDKRFIVIKILFYSSNTNDKLKSKYLNFDFAFKIKGKTSITAEALKHKIMNFVFENYYE